MNESYINSQLGFLHVITENRAVKAVLFMDDYSGEEIVVDKIALKVKTQLEEYFSGQRKNFELDLKPDGTEFQQKVLFFYFQKQLQILLKHQQQIQTSN